MMLTETLAQFLQIIKLSPPLKRTCLCLLGSAVPATELRGFMLAR